MFGTFLGLIYFLYYRDFNLLFLKLYQNKTSLYQWNHDSTLLKSIYFFLAKRWYINLIYNRYLTKFLFFIGYYHTFVTLDKGFFEGIYLIIVRQTILMSSFLLFYLYQNFYFGEFLSYLFIFFFFSFKFWSIHLLVTIGSHHFLLAVPKKKKRSKRQIRFFVLLKSHPNLKKI